MSARIDNVWKKFRQLSGVLVRKWGLSLKQLGKIYQCCVRPVLLYCCETWGLTVADEARLCGVERCMIRMCGVRLVNRVSTNVLHDRVGVAVKIEDIIQSRLQRYSYVVHGGMNSQICEVMEDEITGKRKKGRPRKLWEESIKDLEQYDLRREDVYDRQKWQEQIKSLQQTLLLLLTKYLLIFLTTNLIQKKQ